MLVLSRKVGERIVIGDAVVTIAKIKGDKVKIGIEASKEIKVRRQELITGDNNYERDIEH